MTDPAVAPERVTIFDTTLRDGEQAPGFSMDAHAKVAMAHALADLGVDVIEAGFAAASPGDEEAIRCVAGEVEGVTVCSLARATDHDIAAAARAIRPAARGRIHTFVATSPIHRELKLKMTRPQVKAVAVRAVEAARAACDDVEFSAEDAIRTEPEFLAEVLQAAADAGATTLNVPDTVGYGLPGEITALFAYLKDAIDRPDVVLSCHCHDDLGLAVANSLAAVEGGARQVECTVNGIGERAGNGALEEVVMAIRTRSQRVGVDTRRPHARAAGHQPAALAPDRPAGGAQQGHRRCQRLRARGRHPPARDDGGRQSTYEIMRPADVGADSRLVLGKHSGRHALVERAERLGFRLRGNQVAVAFHAFKRRADEIGLVDDGELFALLEPLSVVELRA